MNQSRDESPSCSQEELLDQSSLIPSYKDKCETKHSKLSKEEIRSDRQKTFPLRISLSYVEDWDTTAAFRELYQNWKDAILEEFDLDRLEFRPLFEDREDCLSIIVPDISDLHQRRRALGFIRYDKETGQTTLVNPCAQLKPEALDLGYSSKRGKSNLTGCHGEGLKLAALVMSRNGYSVKIATANSHWSFSLVGSKFRCMIRSSKMMCSGPDTDPTEDMARMRSHIDRDVMVVIEPAMGKYGKKNSLAAFKTWVKVTLDIRGLTYPFQVIETEAGDLILDPKFCGRIYLKGMLLPATISELKPYKLGYNFTQGRVNRDRQILVDKQEEANNVRQIWESAIQKNEKVVLPIYVDLLRNFPEAPDVESADILLGDATKTLIWRHLLSDTGGKLFYYNEKSSPQSIGIIRDLLTKEPARLPQLLWNLLRSKSLLRTPEEEQIKHFRNARLSASLSCFAQTIQRAVKAGLAFIPGARDVEVHFVQSERGGVDIFFDVEQKALKINHRWLDFQEIHRGNPCRESFPTDMTGREASFFCDHIIDELLRVSWSSIFKHSSMLRAAENKTLRHIRDLLRYMPHSIKVRQTNQKGYLMVTWEDNETESFRNSCLPTNMYHFMPSAMYHVVLHEEKCVNARVELLHGNTVNMGNGFAPCGCPYKFASQINRVAIFGPLDCAKGYYPMIALNRPQAIYGLPPQPIIPNPYLTISQLGYGKEMPLPRTGFQQQPLFAQAIATGMQTVSAGGGLTSQLASRLAHQQQKQQQLVKMKLDSMTRIQSAESRTELSSQSQQIPLVPHEAETSQTSPKRELETSLEISENCQKKLRKSS